MEIFLIYLLMVLIVLAVGCCFGLVPLRLENRGSQEWMVQALELDLKYQPSDTFFGYRFSALKLFNQGRSLSAQNILTGSQRGAGVVLAEYSYVTGSGKNSHIQRQTVCILRSSKMDIPVTVQSWVWVGRAQGFDSRRAAP